MRATLPVSPLSIERRVFELVFALNPKVKPFVLGGDHSTALPPVQALAAVAPQPWGIVQPDAHTDLLETRLGIKHCFATWSWHANELHRPPGPAHPGGHPRLGPGPRPLGIDARRAAVLGEGRAGRPRGRSSTRCWPT